MIITMSLNFSVDRPSKSQSSFTRHSKRAKITDDSVSGSKRPKDLTEAYRFRSKVCLFHDNWIVLVDGLRYWPAKAPGGIRCTRDGT